MSINIIDANMFCTMFLSGARNLELNKEWINDLNVFPVPDGDTGTNMTMTIMSAVKEVQSLDTITMQTLARAISSGSLRGARGNSGVILSQLLRGFTKEIETVEVLDAQTLARALQRASETAYKAVMKPKEGTILTVAKGMAEKAAELCEESEDLETLMSQVIEYGDYVLSQTPEMLPVLKQAGVVDSGGQGLMQVMKGAFDGMLGKEIAAPEPAEKEGTQTEAEAEDAAEEPEEIRFGYCTEFIINLEKPYGEAEEQDLKSYLESLGDSLVLVADEGIVKIHVHTNDPGLAIQKGLSLGSLSRMKIDNMREEHEEKLIRNASKIAGEQKAKAQQSAPKPEPAPAAAPVEPRKEVGFIAVSLGAGMNEIFRELNVDYIIEGGQTMNPSTEDMLTAIRQVNADTIYILPNNKNVILAAEQATHLVRDKKVLVVPSKTMPQGITAVINYSPSRSAEENLAMMSDEMVRVKTGEVTYAVRNTQLDGKMIQKGDIMGIGDHSALLAVGTEIALVARQMIEAMVAEDSELISIYYGADVAEMEAKLLAEAMEQTYPDCDVELHYGGQPIYYYVASVE